MCGIVGIVSSNLLESEDRDAVPRMMSSIGHRGPDGSGHMDFPQAVLGHVRLSIIDIAGGSQPMATDDQKIWIIFNGEIYNHNALRESLIDKGYVFRTHSDTEVLLHTYREYGSDCLKYLNGIFAFAAYDKQRCELFLARDQLGVKPLYFCEEDGKLIFFSELKAFRAYKGKKRLEVDHNSLDCYLANRYVIAPSTLLKGVRKLQPGHFAIWKNGKLVETRYWDLSFHTNHTITYHEAVEKIRSLLQDAVRLQMVSDVPLGVMLSGGLDSTIITALMCQEWGGGVKTFSVASSGNGWWDERQFARIVAERYSTDHHELIIDPEAYLSSFEQMAWDMDDLVADPASILLYHISSLARKHVSVVLSGEGSDEILAGYDYYNALKPWNRQQLFNRIPSPVLPLLGLLSRFSSRLKGYCERYGLSSSMFASAYEGVAGRGLHSQHRKSLVRSELINSYGKSAFDITRKIYERSGSDDIIQNRLYADTMTWLPDNLLTKADRMSMAHGLELRVPFLDHRVVEFCASLPLEFKVRKELDGTFVTKALLRDTFAPEIPSEILTRKKQGFSLNWQEMLATKGKRVVKDVLLSGSLGDIFNKEQLELTIQQLNPDDNYSCQAVLSLALFGFWHQHFLS